MCSLEPQSCVQCVHQPLFNLLPKCDTVILKSESGKAGQQASRKFEAI
jgi:hypothetical protein